MSDSGSGGDLRTCHCTDPGCGPGLRGVFCGNDHNLMGERRYSGLEGCSGRPGPGQLCTADGRVYVGTKGKCSFEGEGASPLNSTCAEMFQFPPPPDASQGLLGPLGPAASPSPPPAGSGAAGDYVLPAVLVVVSLLAVIFVLVFCWWKKKRSKQKRSSALPNNLDNSDDSDDPDNPDDPDDPEDPMTPDNPDNLGGLNPVFR